MAFAHLHVHTQFSLLDGACKIDRLVSHAKNLGQTALAITDHGVMYGAVDFYKECKKQGIKPIIGCEVYVALRSRFDKTYDFDRGYYHLVLLCENNTGYHNLVKLVSKGFTEGFYVKPRIDRELLEKYHEGLICLSACLAGEIPSKLLQNDYPAAKEAAVYLQNVFGKDNFFIELQDHGLDEQHLVNPRLIQIANEIGAGLVATNDCHYIEKSDSQMHDILLCIQTNRTVSDPDRLRYKTEEFYLKSEQQMRSLFEKNAQAIDNTQIIADRCNVELEFGVRKLPNFDVPDNRDHYEYFRELCLNGLYKRYGDSPADLLVKRLNYELSVIKQMGFVDYFLIVSDFVSFAKNHDIPVGPGRGSGAGSLCAYCIGITGIDPIKYNLIFERFLNPERVSMPDFDIDFCKRRRGEVIDYVVSKYGKDRVAQISAFGTMAAKGAIRDVGRALAIPYNVVDGIAKLVPNELSMTIEKALTVSAELKDKYETDVNIHRLIDIAKSIEGLPRHATTHAAGVVITKDPVSDYVPLAKNDDAVVTQYTMTALEELGLLKMDFLGLRNLTVIDDAVKMIRRKDPDFNIEKIDFSDKAVFDLFSLADTDGVFQFESQGMKNVLTQMRPQTLEDLIAIISLYRPGPMDSIPMYIANRRDPKNIKYKHPLLKEILDVTCGCIVYQEQVMQIFRTLAGYSLGRADIVRRAMSKKKHDVMEKEREIFINGYVNDKGEVEVEGCLRRGVSENAAREIFSEMESFASYAFNKSHAAAYAVISYQTAWLKVHFPGEYMASLLSSVLDNQNKLVSYIAECQRMNIPVLPANVNESYSDFTVVKNGIRYGLSAVKNLGVGLINSIVSERKNGDYKSFYDFCKRNHGKGLNSKALESLVKCGALDGLDCNRRQMLSIMKTVLDNLDFESRKNLNGQMSFFDIQPEIEPDNIAVPDMRDFTVEERLKMEKEVAGIYFSGHPIAKYRSYIERFKTDTISNILNNDQLKKYHDGDSVRVVCIVVKQKKQLTKSNKMMSFLTVEDEYGTMEILVFPNTFAQYGHLLMDGAVVEILGSINFKEDEEPKIICNTVKNVPENFADHDKSLSAANKNPRGFAVQNGIDRYKENAITGNDERSLYKKPGVRLYLRIDNLESESYRKCKRLIDIFDGYTPVIFYLTDTKKQMIAPRSMQVDLNDVFIKELRYQIGEENVKIK